MATTNWAGPLTTGRKTGDNKNTIGTVAALRKVQVSADGDYAIQYLPPCDIIGFRVNVEIPYTVTAQTAIRFGTSADEDFYGVINVSARGTYYATNVCASSLLGLTDNPSVIVSVTSVGAAGDGQATVYIEYLQANR